MPGGAWGPAASNSTQGPAPLSAPLRPRLYVYKLASFVRFTHINTHICTYPPLYIHMYTHIFQDNKAKVLGGTYITHPPGSPHTERLHMCYTHMYTHTYIHTHIHTYTHIHVHVCVRMYIRTYTDHIYIHMYILEGTCRRPQESSWNLHT